jgi:protein phosphatase
MTITNINKVHYVAVTHSGKRYRQNQNALLLAGTVQQTANFWQGELSLDKPLRFAIADGVGGLPNAAKASRILLQELAELDQTQPQLLPRQRLIPLHNCLVKACKSDRTLQNGGSTLITTEIATDGQISLWHVGDSRGYLYSPHGLRRLTDDHTLAFCLNRSGNYSTAQQQAIANTPLG